MTTTIPAPPDNARGVDTCGCPTTLTPGTILDRIGTRHRPSCPDARTLGLGAGQTLTTVQYAAGTLDALLDDAFGPVTR